MPTPRLIEKLRLHAVQRPEEAAIRQAAHPQAVVTWKELEEHVTRLAAALRAAVAPRSIVILCSTNRPEFAVAFLALLEAEMHVFPIAVDVVGPELLDAGRRSGAAALLSVGQAELAMAGGFSRQQPFAILAEDVVLCDRPDWPARRLEGAGLLLLSSGTTSRPKIVRRSVASLDAVSQSMVEAIGFTPQDCVIAAVPLCHSYGLEHGLLCPTWAGSCAHLYERFDPHTVVTDLAGSRATIFPGVPFMFEMLTSGGADAGRAAAPAPRLRRAYSAGGPLPAQVYDAFMMRFGMPIAQLYGATEVGSVTFNDPRLWPFDPESVGRPMPGVSIRIVDPSTPSIDRPLSADAEGHVAIHSAGMLSAYLDGEPPPLLDGHFLTGDLGRLSPAGALTITGRIKLLIDIAGRKVNPLEVEQVLSGHPEVGECVVVAMQVTPTLRRLRAVMTCVHPGNPPQVGDIRRFARSRLSAYKVPRVFEFRDSLPRSGAGKILRRLVESESADDPS